MKRCPKCDFSFPDTDEFCEWDGTTLVANNPDSSRKALLLSAVAIGTMALGIAGFVVYQGLTNQTVAENQSSSAQAFTQQVVSPPPPLIAAPVSSETPSPSPSPSPSPTPTPTPTPAVKAETVRVALSTGPIAATAEAGKRGPVTIRLTDGSAIKADEAWETKEGFWYRRRGLVTLLHRDQVKALETPKPTPTPAPSPVPSPS